MLAFRYGMLPRPGLSILWPGRAGFLAGALLSEAPMDATNSPIPLMPCSDDAQGGAAYDEAPRLLTALSALPFAYDGRALTLDAFIRHVETYDFGPIAPSQIVLHNTANPAASWAPSPGVPNWDDHEIGLTEARIRNKRAKQLANIRDFYISKGWSAGPHLFVDDRWVWLFTPMDTIGIHANSGNSYRIGGALRYSIGIEVVGRYATQKWPPIIIRQLRGAIGALSVRLGIRIAYTPAPHGQPAKHDGQLALHRNYATDGRDCPGLAIEPLWMTQVLAPTTPPPPPPQPPTTGAGFYRARAPMWISETPSPFGPIALQGAAVVEAGEVLDIDEVKNGYAHTRSGVGFLPAGGLEQL